MSDRPQTEALIAQLAQDLRPVRRLAPAGRRAGLWTLAVLWMGLLLSFFVDFSTLATRLMATPDMWLSAAGAAATAILASVAALQTAVPGRSVLWPLLPLPALAIWVGASAAGCLRLVPAAATVPEPAMHPMLCMQFLLLVSLPLSGLLIWLLASACPLRPGLTASLGGLASAAAAAALLNLIHPFDANRIDLLLHAAIVILVVLATRLAALGFLRTN